MTGDGRNAVGAIVGTAVSFHKGAVEGDIVNDDMFDMIYLCVWHRLILDYLC